MHRIGIIQGRLSPLINGKIQAFPLKFWKQEFPILKECGFDVLEWVFDSVDTDQNPILSVQGRKEICSLKKEFQIEIPSVCSDYFMEVPLLSKEKEIDRKSFQILEQIIPVCPEVGIQFVELPLIGALSVKEEKAQNGMKKILEKLFPGIKRNKIKILLEFDAPPPTIAEFLKGMPEFIQVNYDTGNSAYWQFDVDEEMKSYGHKIGSVHIKDCTPKDYSVLLGKGNVDFDKTFKLLKENNYAGDFILQTVRSDNHMQAALEFKNFTKNFVKKYFHGS